MQGGADGILDKQQVVESLVEGVKDNIPNLTAYESNDLNNLRTGLTESIPNAGFKIQPKDHSN